MSAQGSFATGSSRQQIQPCPLCRRKRRQSGHCRLHDRPVAGRCYGRRPDSGYALM